MAKYSYEFKLQIVEAYKNGEGGYRSLAKKYGVASDYTVEEWVKAYKAKGASALVRSRERTKYTFEEKLKVVELYLTNEISYQELALQRGIRTPATICRWVKDFRRDGPEALREKHKGEQSEMAWKNQNPSAELQAPATDAERIKVLEDELLKLRIENAYLKELRRLRLEEERLQKIKQESSTVSEDNSN